MTLKYLADENIPLITVNTLKKKNIDVVSIFNIQRGMKDRLILQYAFEHNMIILTFDKDFGKLIAKEKLPSKGLILFRIIPKSPEYITQVISRILTQYDFDPKEKLLIVHENYIRTVSIRY